MSEVVLANLSIDAWGGRRVMPLGCLGLEAALVRAGIEVELRDVQLCPGPARDAEALARFLDADAPVLGVSVMADRLPLAILALERLRARRPEQLTVLGGPGPTEVAEPLLRAFSHIDGVVVGEGEETLVELVRRFRERGRDGLSGIPGLWLRRAGQVARPPARRRIRDLDDLAYPRWSSVDLSRYDVVSLVTSRGCPHRCAFCSAGTIWGDRTCRRSIPNVVEELRWLTAARPGVHVHIEDDTFTLARARVTAFCEALAASGPSCEWGCTARVGDLDEPLLETMREAGCRFLFLGIEAGSDRLLASLGKKTTVKESLRAVRLAARFVEVTAHAIWGYPAETLQDFFQTHLLMAYLRAVVSQVGMSHYVPFAGSPLVQGWSGALLPLQSYPFPRLVNLGTDPAERALVSHHPEIFLPFFALETPGWETKIDVARRFHELSRPTSLPRPGRPEAREAP